MLDRVCAKAELEQVTPHVLRHTFASVAGDLGFSELTIAGLLGHSARGVTQGYVHLDTAGRRREPCLRSNCRTPGWKREYRSSEKRRKGGGNKRPCGLAFAIAGNGSV
jgi:hypothetical protein